MINAIIHHVFRWLLRLSIVFIILFAVFISVLRVAVNHAIKDKNFAYLSKHILHEPVTVGHLSTSWYGFQPQVHLDNLVILDRTSRQPLLKIHHLVIQINLIDSLLHWSVLPSRLIVNGAQLTVNKDKQGAYYVKGLPHPHRAGQKDTKLKSVILWVLTQSDLSLKNISVNWLNQVVLKRINFDVKNDGKRHRFGGHVQLNDTDATQLQFIAHLNGDGDQLSDMDGQIYVSANHFSQVMLRVIKQVAPQLNKLKLANVAGNVKTWLTIKQGQLTTVLADYVIQDMTIAGNRIQGAVGRIRWERQPEGARVVLRNRQGMLVLPNVYTHPLAVGNVALDAAYQPLVGGFNVTINTLQLDNPTLYIDARAHVIKHKGQVPTLDFMSSFTVHDMSHLKEWVPQKLLKPHLSSWLQQAFIKGAVTQGQVVLRGPLQPHFFDGHRGVFGLTAHIKDATVSYAPTWPVAHNADVDLSIRNRLLEAHSTHLMAGANNVDQLFVRIPLVENSVLTIKLHATTRLESAWHYVEKTPMKLADELRDTHFSGPMKLNLALRFPLHGKPHNDVTTTGNITTPNGQLLLPRWNLTINKIQGRIQFHNQAVSGDALLASLFGSPVTINLSTIRDHKWSTIKISTVGALSPQAIAQHFSLPLAHFFSGSSAFAADLLLHDADSGLGNELHITSDLRGIKTVSLPAPFAKAAAIKRPIAIDIAIKNKKPLFFRVHYGTLASAAMVYHRTAHGLTFMSGNIKVGGGMATYLTQPGLVITGYLPQLDWHPWQVFLNGLMGAATNKQATHQSIPLRLLTLRMGALDVGGSTYHNLNIQLKPVPRGLLLSVQGKQVDGTVFVPKDHAKTWVLQFERLYFNGKKNKFNDTLNPEKLPPLAITINKLVLSKTSYGTLIVNTQPTLHGLTLNRLELKSPDYDIHTTGYWHAQNGKQQTYLKGKLVTTNLGKLLQLWQKKKIFLEGKGGATFTFWWGASPLHMDMKTLIGMINYGFHDGSFVAIDKQSETKIGIGRILNLLSVGSLLRRLEFKFHDLTDKGLWFDHFTGQWTFGGGLATTRNTAFSGPVAQIQMRGQFGLAQKSSNLWLNVTPQLTSSVPTVIGFVGGPIAGVAAWVVNKIVGPEIDKISASTYHVTGTWKHPKITKVTS